MTFSIFFIYMYILDCKNRVIFNFTLYKGINYENMNGIWTSIGENWLEFININIPMSFPLKYSEFVFCFTKEYCYL